MNKVKKIRAILKQKSLIIWYLVSRKTYWKAINKYLKFMGINLIGNVKFCARDVKFDFTDPSLITIGNGTVITSKVTILVHDYSIECGLVAIGKQDAKYESLFLKKVIIGDNCFIGQNSFIKPGTVIGNNCIIGAGAVVSGNIPDNSIVIGNPGMIVKDTKVWAEKKFSEKKYLNGNKRLKS